VPYTSHTRRRYIDRAALFNKEEITMSRIAILLASSLAAGLASPLVHSQQSSVQGGPGAGQIQQQKAGSKKLEGSHKGTQASVQGQSKGPQTQQKIQKSATKAASPVPPKGAVKASKTEKQDTANQDRPPDATGSGSRVGGTTSLR
jgi:hypothetical protein